MTVVFACKSVHFKDDSVVNTQEMSLLAFLLERIRDEVLVIPRLLPVTGPWGRLSWYSNGNREEIESVLDEFLRSILQEVSARAVGNADVPVRQAYFALCFGSTSSSSHNSCSPSRIMSFDSLLKRLIVDVVEDRFEVLSMRVVLDLLNQTLNVLCHVIVSLQNVVVLEYWSSSSLIARLNSLSVLNNATSRCSSGANCSFTMCALELFRSSGCPDTSWVCSTRVFPDRLSGFPDRSEEPSSSCKRFSSISWKRWRFTFNNKHIFCVLRFPWSITDWFGSWLG